MVRRAMRWCLALAWVAACNGPTPADGNVQGSDRVVTLHAADQLRLQIVPDLDWRTLPADPATISAASVEGSRLRLTVQFGGGCEPHEFALVAGTDLAESNPPYTLFRLIHDANGDGCEAWITRSLTVDLSPIEPLVRQSGARALRFELVEPGERLSGIGELRLNLEN